MSEKENSLLSVLEMIDARISHIEDIESDNREIIIKLVKQSNQIVKFLKNLEVELVEDEEGLDITTNTPELPFDEDQNYIKPSKIKHIKELIEEFMDKYTDLADLEKELRKYKDQITLGTIGES